MAWHDQQAFAGYGEPLVEELSGVDAELSLGCRAAEWRRGWGGTGRRTAESCVAPAGLCGTATARGTGCVAPSGG